MAPFSEPLQARSRETLARIVDAAEELLAEKGFQGASMAEICARAEVTTGAFYARFRRKADLLDALTARFRAETSDAWALLEEPPPSLEEAVQQFLVSLVAFYRRRRTLVQALSACARADAGMKARLQDLNAGSVERFASLLSRYEPEIRHPDPPLACRVGLIAVIQTVWEVVVERRMQTEASYGLSDEDLVAQLRRMLVLLLCSPPDGA